MSLRAAKRNARLSLNYGLPAPATDCISYRVQDGTAFRPQEPNAFAQRSLEKLLSNGERLLAEQRRTAGEQHDGDEAKGDDRNLVGEREALPYNPFAI